MARFEVLLAMALGILFSWIGGVFARSCGAAVIVKLAIDSMRVPVVVERHQHRR